jgi:DNA-binding response OmpR family regulator
MRILVVEDEEKTARGLLRALTEEGYAADHAADGDEGLYLAQETAYDAILLDVRLPRMDGVTLCRTFRAKGGDTPILMLTANTLTGQKVVGLDAGADDYVAKPFDLEELLARLRALVRRKSATRSPVLRFGDLELDPRAHAAMRGGRPLDLTTKEFSLLEVFVRKPGEVLSRMELLEACWDMNFESDSNVVDVHIASLRKKLEAGRRGRLIQTVRGAGYALRERP